MEGRVQKRKRREKEKEEDVSRLAIQVRRLSLRKNTLEVSPNG
jgi:hypothetical protein